MSHSMFAPSASARWLSCTASIPAILKDIDDGVPQEDGDSVFALEGSRAHKVAEHAMLDLEWDPTEHVGAIHEGDKYLEPFEVAQDMADGAITWRSYILEHYDPECPESDIGIEHRSPLFYRQEDGGTVDCWVYEAASRTLHVIDYKFGKGVRVEAEGNSQLRIYAGSLALELKLLYDIETVACHIVMPRLHHYVSEYMPVEELEEFMADTLQVYVLIEASVEKLVVDREFNLQGLKFCPSEKNCKWCPRAGFCEARARNNYETLGMDFEDLDAMPEKQETYLPEFVTSVLKQRKEIEAWLKDVQNYAYTLLEKGEKVPGWKLVEGKSNRKWSDEEAALEVLRKVFAKGDVVTEKVVTPTKALDLCKAKKKRQATVEGIKALIVKPEGKPTLAPESDKRPALASALDEFDDLDLDILN